MTDLMTNLYEFTSRRRMGCVWDDPEYQAFSRCADAKEDALRARLDPEGQQLLDDMLSEQLNRFTVEMEAIFQAAFTLCRELNGILRG